MFIIVVIGIVAAFGYYMSLKAHPFTKCKFCNGTARHFGTTFTYAHRRCRKCGGTGRKDRLGARLFTKS
jgi:DnaJ-class molecular chaperone